MRFKTDVDPHGLYYPIIILVFFLLLTIGYVKWRRYNNCFEPDPKGSAGALSSLVTRRKKNCDSGFKTRDIIAFVVVGVVGIGIIILANFVQF